METAIEYQHRLERLEIRLALQDLNNNFCYFLDNGNIDGLVDLFCEDARYSHGERVSHGTDEIRQLFQRRGLAEVRTSRHLQTGLRITIKSRTCATGESVCMTFAANMPPPVTPASPYLVADFRDEYELCPDGGWRIKKRHIERIFTASENKGPVGRKGGRTSEDIR